MGPNHRLYGRFTEPARRVLQLANEDARERNHEYVGTEHLLLGLVKHGHGAGAEALKNLGVNPLQLRQAVEKQLQSGPSPVGIGKLSRTPRAKRVIEFSLEEAERFGHNYVGTEHLLLGLMREKEGLAAQALAERQLTLEKLRAAVLFVLGSSRANQD
jgi:ATP-dependent Clp protease ATP-binding subunit ClpC